MIGYTNKKYSGQPEAEWKGYILASGFFVVAILQSTFFHQNFHISMTAGMRARSALIAAVFKKVCVLLYIQKLLCAFIIANLRKATIMQVLFFLFSKPVTQQN